MKKKLGLLIIVLLFLTSSSLFCRAAQPSNNWQSWLNLGLGVGGNSDIYGEYDFSLAAVANYTFQKGKHIVSIRGAACTVFLNAGTISDVGVLYGRVLSSSRALVTLSAGLALVTYGFDSSEKVFGVPLELQIFAKKNHRIGLYGFANINAKKSLCGLCLCLRLGQLKK